MIISTLPQIDFDEYSGTEVNVTGFIAEYNNIKGIGSGKLTFEGGAKVIGLQGSASL